MQVRRAYIRCVVARCRKCVSCIIERHAFKKKLSSFFLLQRAFFQTTRVVSI